MGGDSPLAEGGLGSGTRLAKALAGDAPLVEEELELAKGGSGAARRRDLVFLR